MNCKLRPLSSRQDHDLKNVSCAIRAEHQPPVGIFAGVFDEQRMVDGMDVRVCNAVLARKRVYLHRDYRTT